VSRSLSLAEATASSSSATDIGTSAALALAAASGSTGLSMASFTRMVNGGRVPFVPEAGKDEKEALAQAQTGRIAPSIVVSATPGIGKGSAPRHQHSRGPMSSCPP